MLIHAGVHQTGTARIKAFLSAHEQQLADQGVFFPIYNGREESASASISHKRLAWDIHRKKISLNALQDWARLLAQSDADTIILSAEDFCRLLDVSFLDVFTDQFEVELVMYVRRQDEWVNSWYNLNIKWPFDARLCQCNPIEFLDYLDEFYWIRYFDTVERWAGRLGVERIHVRVAESGQVEDPVADFNEVAGIDLGPASAEPQAALAADRIDREVSSQQLEMLRRLGTLGYSDSVRIKITNAVRRASATTGTNVYHREVRQLIVDRYAIQNQKLARQYLGRSNGDLFRDAAFPDDPVGLEDGLDEDVLYAFIRKLIYEFYPHVGDN